MLKRIARYRKQKKRKEAIRHRKEMALRKRNPRKYRRYLKERRKRIIIRNSILTCFVLILVLIGVGINMGISAAVQKSRDRRAAIEQAKIDAEAAAREEAARIAAEQAEIERGKDITIAATGTMLMHGPILNARRYSDGNGGYDYSDIYKYIKPYYSAPDFMTCEFEGALTGEDYSGYPTFHAPDEIVKNYTDAGIDLTMIASNHVYDGLQDGFHRMMNTMDSKNWKYTGIRQKVEDPNYYIAEIDGIKIGYINYVYEQKAENGMHGLNYIPIEDSDWALINTFNENELDAFYREMETSLNAMRADGAQFLVVNMHWGIEYNLHESDTQRSIAQKLCDMGVDAVIGGHPHCEQPIDVFESTDKTHSMFCIFSVGNALSNQRKEIMNPEMPTGHTEDGVIIELTLHCDKDGNVTITGVNLIPTWVYMEEEDENNKYYILPLDDIASLENNSELPYVYSNAQASYDRTMEVMGEGLKKAKEVFENAAKDKANKSETETGDEASETLDMEENGDEDEIGGLTEDAAGDGAEDVAEYTAEA